MKINRLITQLFILILISGNLFAQQDLQTIMRERGEYFFSLNSNQSSEIQFINSICSVAKIEDEDIICYANQKQYDNLLKLGYQPDLLLPPSMQNEVKMWNGRGTYDWDTFTRGPSVCRNASVMFPSFRYKHTISNGSSRHLRQISRSIDSAPPWFNAPIK